jgi:hypothetical protein
VPQWNCPPAMGIMVARLGAGSEGSLLLYCREPCSRRAAVPARLAHREVEKMHAAHANSRGLSQRVHRPLRDRLDSWIAGMIRPSCTKSSRFSRNSWSIPRANLALYYRRPWRRWSAPATGCYQRLSAFIGGFRNDSGLTRCFCWIGGTLWLLDAHLGRMSRWSFS